MLEMENIYEARNNNSRDATVRWNVAITLEGERVWIDEYSGGNVCCPECKVKMIAKRGEIVRHHFAHKDNSKCSGENAQHWTRKYQIADCLDKLGSVKLDGEIKGYKVDILFQNKWAFEVVYSNPLSQEKIDSLAENLIIFNFRDESVWGDMNSSFKGKSLEQIIEFLGNIILNDEVVKICNNCRELKSLDSGCSAIECKNCNTIKKLRFHRESRGLSSGINRHKSIIPNIIRSPITWHENGIKHSINPPSGRIIDLVDPKLNRLKSRYSWLKSNKTAEEVFLDRFMNLLESAKHHNKWSLTTPGYEKYHLSSMKFKPFEGDEIYSDRCIDAISKHLSTRFDTPQGFPEFGEIMVPQWLNSQTSVITEYRSLMWKKRIHNILVQLENNSTPLILTDTAGIDKIVMKSPLKGKYHDLVMAISCAKSIPDKSKHPSLISLMQELQNPYSESNAHYYSK